MSEIKSSYLVSVQNYFLSLRGEGLMLSPKDYDMIMQWQGRGIPKEVIYRGINKTFEDFKRRYRGGKKPKSLSYCARAVEEEMRAYKKGGSAIITTGPEEKNLSKGKALVDEVAGRLVERISIESREEIKRLYIKARNQVLGLRGMSDEAGGVLERIERIENEFYEGFFLSLSEEKRGEIEQEAALLMGKRGRFMSDNVRRENLKAIRREILKRTCDIEDFVSGG